MKSKKILMVGVLDVPSSTNVFMAKGFKQLGYEVEAYNYRTRLKELGSVFAMWNDFKKFLRRKIKYELIVFCKTNQMHPEMLDLTGTAPTWYWFMDPLSTAEATIADEYARHATYASATSSEVLELFKKANPNSFQIIEGYDPDIYFYEDLEKIYDITFIGNATTQRIIDILSLKAVIDNKRIHVFGSGWPYSGGLLSNPVYNEEERRVINQSKIVLNLCQDKTMFSDRVVKSLACGALVLSQHCLDLDKQLHEIQNGKDNSLLQLWDSTASAHHLISLYLTISGISKYTRQTLANYMKINYSWKAVCQQIMEKVK